MKHEREGALFLLGVCAGVLVTGSVWMLSDRSNEVLPACQTPMTAVAR